jgi:isopenicillin-N N-acyltransferase-like protein
VVAVAGGPRERGRAYGERARDRVHRSLALYEGIFRHYTGMRWAAVRDRAGVFAGPIDEYDTRLLPEIEGIAEGARVDAEDILALNVRTEVMFGMVGGVHRAVYAGERS